MYSILDNIDTFVFAGNGVKAYVYTQVIKILVYNWWEEKMRQPLSLLENYKPSVRETEQFIKKYKEKMHISDLLNYYFFENHPFFDTKCRVFKCTLVDLFFKEKINVFAGTSSGSMTSFFLSCNVEIQYLERHLRKAKKVLDLHLFNPKVNNLFDGVSIFNHDFLKKEIITVFSKYNIPPSLTFKEHYEKYKKVWMCNAVCLDTGENVMMNYQTTPDVPVLDAILASCALFLIFPPVLIDGKYFIDGGFAIDFLMPLFPPLTTFGITMCNKGEPHISTYSNKIAGLKSIKEYNGDFTFGQSYHKDKEYDKSQNGFYDTMSKSPHLSGNQSFKKIPTFLSYLLNHITKMNWERLSPDHLQRIIHVETDYNFLRANLMTDLKVCAKRAVNRWYKRNVNQLLLCISIKSFKFINNKHL